VCFVPLSNSNDLLSIFEEIEVQAALKLEHDLAFAMSENSRLGSTSNDQTLHEQIVKLESLIRQEHAH
jgi:hypothetical protein